MSGAVTIAGLLLEGSVEPAPRVGRDDLLLAAEVIEAYEPEADDPDAPGLAAVAAMLRKMARDRDVERWVRALTAEAARNGLNVSTPQAKSVIRRAAEERVP